MPPSGEGVNLAMLDALELCEALTSVKYTNLKEATATYEVLMQQRSVEQAKMAMEMTEMMHADNAQER